MVEFDEAALESEQSVAAADPSRLIYTLATAGAQVRMAIAAAAEAEPVRADQPPRAVLVAGDRIGAPACGLLAALGSDVAPVISCDGPVLPRWAGAADALLVATADGRHPRLAGLVDQASRRGLIIVAVAPEGSPVAEAGRVIGRDVSVVHPRAARWSLLAPLIQAGVDLGVVDAPAAAWEAVADALDEVAETARPGGDPFASGAKQLAAELAESVAVIAGAGSLAALAAVTMATSLALLACTPAVSLALPEEIAAAGALISRATREGGGRGAEADFSDFFRDRVEEDTARPRLIVVGDDPLGGAPSEADGPLGDLAAARAARALLDIAGEAGVRASTVDVPDAAALARYAAACAFGDFTAAYLGIGLGIDPGAPRPGELAH